ncbi:hypothetical protein [Sandarakinorhabdus sp.]|uniref:hypothetical protein n=1 Tax=Sandarakinorhabdus sp. TaxID=1916663 RepID=UPI00286E6E66|nr:hypothetical protein [Sandarakinorhabdus sp.]
MADRLTPSSPLPGAVLRLWMLAEIGMAALYWWQYQLLSALPGAALAVPPPRQVSVLEGLYLVVFVPAVLVLADVWQRTRDARLAWAALAYGLLSAASFAAWPQAASIADMRLLTLADAGISLSGLIVAAAGLFRLARP